MPNDKYRCKVLWARSGFLCAICKDHLWYDPSQNNTSTIIVGEECHIVSRSSNGPRHQPDFVGYDDYANLLLLCSKHHKIIDSCPDEYSSEKLRDIKTTHERWVLESLQQNALQNSRIHQPSPYLNELIVDGVRLVSMLKMSEAICHSYDHTQDDVTLGNVFTLLQNSQDYLDIIGDIPVRDLHKVAVGFQQTIDDIYEQGCIIAGGVCRSRVHGLVGGADDSLVVCHIHILRYDSHLAEHENRSDICPDA